MELIDAQLLALWLARALHVAGVVLWIGGVAFVTTALLPAIRAGFPPDRQLPEFERYERRFGRQARWSTQLVGASGLFMLWKLELWSRFTTPGAFAQFGWMHAMVGVYALFTMLLFVIEPLFFHRLLQTLAKRNPALPMRLMSVMHWVLLTISLVTVAWAMAGAHGWRMGG